MPATRPIFGVLDRYVTVVEAAEYLTATRQTLDNWRYAKAGPPYYRIGGRVVYHLDDLRAWVEARRVVPEQ